MSKRLKGRGLRDRPLFFVGLVVLLAVGCSSIPQSNNPVTARSPIVPPDQTAACAITQSSIDSFVVKGRSLAYNGAQFGNVGTYTYLLAEATGKVKATGPLCRHHRRSSQRSRRFWIRQLFV
jgi:hypothetical protein